MVPRSALLIVSLTLVSCQALLGLDDPATAPGDVDAGIDAATGCVPACVGDELTSCVDDAPVVTSCALGCRAAAEAACRQPVPSNGAVIDDLVGVTGGLAVAAGRKYFIDTDDGSIEDLTDPATPVTIRAAGTGVVAGLGFRVVDDGTTVLAVDELQLVAGGELHGVGVRALIVLARRDVIVAGDLDFSAGCVLTGGYTNRCGGPGGGHGATLAVPALGCAPGSNGRGSSGAGTASDETGGGGGGRGGPGAPGGAGTGAPGIPGGVGGDPASCPDASLVPLVGGSGGGAGGVGAADGMGGEGGGGGGALQITSLTRIVVDAPADAKERASIFVGGAGGGAARAATQGGGGGGAGGAILLEAPIVIVGSNGALAANGGGGGSGTVVGQVGTFGRRGPSQAPGGAGSGADQRLGRGGAGGAAAGPPEAGGGGTDGGGGGGGGIGAIRINGRTIDTNDGYVTPAHHEGVLAAE